MAFETNFGIIPWHHGPKGAERPKLIELLRQVMAEPRPPGRNVPANVPNTASAVEGPALRRSPDALAGVLAVPGVSGFLSVGARRRTILPDKPDTITEESSRPGPCLSRCK